MAYKKQKNISEEQYLQLNVALSTLYSFGYLTNKQYFKIKNSAKKRLKK
jgi:hypothetical protein